MLIQTHHSIKTLQKEFSHKYPGLKIEFYAKKHADHEGSPKEEQISAGVLLTELNPKLQDVEVKLDPQMSVKEVEDLFETKLGLHAQIFRRSNSLWLQTSATDDWTLEKQNTKGLHSVQN